MILRQNRPTSPSKVGVHLFLQDTVHNGPVVFIGGQTDQAEHSVHDHEHVHTNDGPMVQEDEADESDSEETTDKGSVP
ncbi:hypothetical protein OUZ56_030015 [Daphnia magna]|uniref:Uncharacterized protein n=1 Tax=Daphnia magna TaxID=35525 RepID=A0ABR0B8G9_9CRUS|nr:hypothetical protein OUZ56_030015 [Daphnia magna]